MDFPSLSSPRVTRKSPYGSSGAVKSAARRVLSCSRWNRSHAGRLRCRLQEMVPGSIGGSFGAIRRAGLLQYARTCTLTVHVLMNSAWAISLFALPCARRCRTSSSREVRPAGFCVSLAPYRCRKATIRSASRASPSVVAASCFFPPATPLPACAPDGCRTPQCRRVVVTGPRELGRETALAAERRRRFEMRERTPPLAGRMRKESERRLSPGTTASAWWEPPAPVPPVPTQTARACRSGQRGGRATTAR